SEGGVLFFFSSRRRHTRSYGDWSSDVCSSDLSKVRFVVTKQLSSSGAATRPDKRQCSFPMALPKCCSSFVAMTSQKKCPSTSRVVCRRSRISRFFIEQRFEKCLATKSSSKSSWKTRAQGSVVR